LSLCHPAVISLIPHFCIILIPGGQASALINLCVSGSVPGGHMKVPWRTCLKAVVYTLCSMNISTSGMLRKGVCCACVYHRLASSRHIISSLPLVFEDWHSEGLCCGPQTVLRPLHWPFIPVACAICLALSLNFPSPKSFSRLFSLIYALPLLGLL